MRALPGFAAELSLDKSLLGYKRRGRSTLRSVGAVIPSGTFVTPWPVEVGDSLPDDISFGGGPPGCRFRPKRCCETDEKGKCRIWVSGCQECP